jgi:cysteine desulfurase
MIYLDYCATTPISEEALNSYTVINKEYWGNPSSLHKFGSTANTLFKKAGDQVLSILKAKNHDVIFTSGATESNNIAIRGIAFQYRNRGNHIITTEIEHNSVYQTCQHLEEQGFKITYLKVNDEGLIDLEELKQAITKETILVSMMYVNGEIGSIMPIQEVGKLIKERNKHCFFHVDMVQAFGKVAVDISRMKIDLASISGHKIYGPKGVGVLIKDKKLTLHPISYGGGQQHQVRSGTIDVASAVSFSKAARLIYEGLEEHGKHVKELSDLLYQNLRLYEDVLTLNSNQKTSSHFIVNFSLHNIKAETMVHALAEHDIYVSSKSACSSKTTTPSRILQAIGRNDALASHSIRISLSHLTKKEDLITFFKVFDQVLKELLVK